MPTKADALRAHRGGVADSVAEVDAQIYGAVQAPDSGRIVAKPISIFAIDPDRAQPRRAIPLALQGVPAGELFGRWARLAEDERGDYYEGFDAYFETPDNFERPAAAGPIEAAFLELIDLAASIRREGLVNPISVVENGPRFGLETGERRWLAYHFLYVFYDEDKKWDSIPARVLKAFDVWRQASENGARSSLNAIGKARQLARLVMALYPSVQFAAFDEMVGPGACDRAYYAQVADGEQFRVPRGKAAAIAQVMGIKGETQLRFYRTLLRASDALWVQADAENWNEATIRAAMIQKSSGHSVKIFTLSPLNNWLKKVEAADLDTRRNLAKALREAADRLERERESNT